MSISTQAQTVILTVPKFVAITSATNHLQKIKPAMKASTEPIDDIINMAIPSNGGCDGAPRGKKRRLDHLSWEEKIQRKKLKNRVAAQTSRDRKKARMEEMEQEIHNLTEKTELLQNKCESLQTINNSLLEKNQKLDIEIQLLKQQLTNMCEKNWKKKESAIKQEIQREQDESSNFVTNGACESITIGSAVSKYTDPLQQGSQLMETQTPKEQKRNDNLAALWRIIALCLLYKTCCSSMKTSMPGSWKNLPKVYSQISQQTWMQAIERATKLMPKLKAVQSDCLDQWWGPQQRAWNPANILQPSPTKVAS